MEEPGVTVRLPAFRPRTGLQNFHKTIESAHVHSEETRHKADNVSGRHTDICVIPRGDPDGKRLYPVLTRKPGVCNQQEKSVLSPLTIMEL